MKKYICFVLFLFCFGWANAQNLPNFNRWYRFPNTYNTAYFAVLPTDSAYYVSGWTLVERTNTNYSMFIAQIVKTDLQGNVLWVDTIGGGNDSTGTGLATQSADMVEFAGLIFVYGNGQDIATMLNFAYVAAINPANGQVVWEKKIQTCGSSFGIAIDAQKASNNKLILQIINFEYGNYCQYALQLDANLDSIHSFTYPRYSTRTFGSYSVENQQGDYIMFAKSNLSANPPDWYENVIFHKLDTAMQLIRSDSFPIRLSYLSYGKQLKRCKYSSNMLLVGGEVPNPRYPNQISPYVFKVDSNFNLLWRTQLRGAWRADLFTANAILEQDDESLTVFGTNGFAGHNEAGGFIAKLSPTGAIRWMRGIYHDNLSNTSQTISNAAETADNGFIICVKQWCIIS